MSTMTHPPKLYSDAEPADLFTRWANAYREVARQLAEALIPAARKAARAAAKINAIGETVYRQAEAAGVSRRELLADPRAALIQIEVFVSGLEGRYLVRAGLDPSYASPAALDVLVKRTMQGRPEDPADPTPDLTRRTRARLAAAAIRGWVEAHPTG